MSDDLGYKPATPGPGKESFKPKAGKENKHGNAPRQDGGNSKGSVNAGDYLWDHDDSEGDFSDESKE